MKHLEIARRRMRNSRLTETAFKAPDEVVRWHGAMQAQDYGPGKWSIGQRATNLVDDDVDRALATGSIVRTHVLRPTWHFVARDDVRWLLALTGPRVQQHNAPRYRGLGLDEQTLTRCEALIVSALEGGNHLTRGGIAAVLDDARIDRSGQRLPFILLHCELDAAICSGGLEGKQQTYALLDERVPSARGFDPNESLAELVRRYLTSHGPASVQDLRWWSSLRVADLKNALHELASELQQETVDDITLWSIASEGSRPPSGRGVHLLQPYDELIVGYTESRHLGDSRATTAGAARRDRNMPGGLVLLNGSIAGHWRRVVQKNAVRIEVLLYEQPTRSDARALGAAARDLGRFLGRQVSIEATRI